MCKSREGLLLNEKTGMLTLQCSFNTRCDRYAFQAFRGQKQNQGHVIEGLRCDLMSETFINQSSGSLRIPRPLRLARNLVRQ